MKQRAIKFYKTLDKILMGLGAKREEYISTQYRYTLSTDAGLLDFMFDKWDGEYQKSEVITVYSRFDDIVRMKHYRQTSNVWLIGVNEFSGKWNHHYHNHAGFDAKGELEWFQNTLTAMNASKPIEDSPTSIEEAIRVLNHKATSLVEKRTSPNDMNFNYIHQENVFDLIKEAFMAGYNIVKK